MKVTHEELGAWIANNPHLYSARSNSDVETIANEARSVLEDDSITHDDVLKAAQAYNAQVKQAAEKHAATVGEAAGVGEGKTEK